MTPGAVRGLRAALLKWYDATKRDLPWRGAADPYHIWLSESLLQQTRVETVLPYYERFVAEFPTLADLAAAPLDRVLHLWQGLGYYSRARNLHRAARMVMIQHGGRMPGTSGALRELPGVGPYTAAAVASIAFGEPVAAVDGNVKRVVARLFRVEHAIDTPRAKAEIDSNAQELLASRRPGDFNQAMMELGATMCTPRTPRCQMCPVRGFCAARKANVQHELPRRRPKRAVPVIHAVAAAVLRRKKLLLLQRPERGLLGGLWEMPGGEIGDESAAAALCRALKHTCGLRLNSAAAAGELRHVFTHRDLRLRVFRATADGQKLRLTGHVAARWVGEAELSEIPLATLDRKAIRVALGNNPI